MNENNEDKSEVIKIEQTESRSGWKVLSLKRKILVTTFVVSVFIYLSWMIWS